MTETDNLVHLVFANEDDMKRGRAIDEAAVRFMHLTAEIDRKYGAKGEGSVGIDAMLFAIARVIFDNKEAELWDAIVGDIAGRIETYIHHLEEGTDNARQQASEAPPAEAAKDDQTLFETAAVWLSPAAKIADRMEMAIVREFDPDEETCMEDALSHLAQADVLRALALTSVATLSNVSHGDIEEDIEEFIREVRAIFNDEGALRVEH